MIIKKSFFVTILALFCLLCACKADKTLKPIAPVTADPMQYSTWIVNNDSFKSNDIDAGYGKAAHGFRSKGFNNRFAIVFYLDHLPRYGEWPIVYDNLQQDPGLVTLGFYYQNKPYGISLYAFGSLKASEKNNKASYYLAPTWFVNTDNENDSVLIQGVFNEP